jgi:hypothetical protein
MMKLRRRRRRRSPQRSLFEEQAATPRRIHEAAMEAAVVDALADLLLEAARPSRGARSSAGGQDDESQDHG